MIPSRLGDCLRALSVLRPDDDATGLAIVAVLGLRPRATPLLDDAMPVPRSVDDEDPDPEVAPREPPVSQPIGDDDPLPPMRDATLTALDDRAQAAPDWLREVAPMPRPDRVANPFRVDVAPLFEPKWQRAIITRLAATWQPGSAIDVDAVVAAIAAGRPLDTVPRLSVKTARHGVHVLVDQGESMQPFRLDVAQLLRAFRRTIGPSRLRIEGFDGLPSLGVSSGLEWHAFKPRADAMPVVIVSDLGLPPRPGLALSATADDWQRFFADHGARGMLFTAVVPRAARLLPRALSRHAWIVPWDRRTGVSRLGAIASTADNPADRADVHADDDAIDDLVCASALAIRVEPRLLRALRVAIAPTSGVEAEAAMWFDDRVADRATTGIVIAEAARPALLARLREKPSLAAMARQIVARAHEDAPVAVRLEEQATWYWLIGDGARAASILRRMVATVVSPERADAWRWAARAVERLPAALMAVEEGQMLALGTAMRSGESSALQALGHSSGRHWQWLRPTTRQIELAVTLRLGAIEFGPVTARSRTTMRVPDHGPVWIDIVPDDREDETRRVRIHPARRMLVTIDGDRFDLAVIGGDRVRLVIARPEQPGDSKRRFVNQNTAPCVEIEYQVEWYGAEQSVQLPFVIGVLADLAGHPQEPRKPLGERKFRGVDIDNFDAVMAALRPRVAFAVPDTLAGHGMRPIDLVFTTLGEFSPAAVVRRIQPLRAMLESRTHILALVGYLDGRVDAQSMVEGVLQQPSLLEQPTGKALADLRRTLRPATAESWKEIVDALRAVAAAVAGSSALVGHDAGETLMNVVADIDARLSAQLDPILHHADFLALEGRWRGLHFLVAHSDTGPMLKIRVLDVSRRELDRELRRHAGDLWDQGALFRMIYELEFGVTGGQPYGCLIADFAFDHRPDDVATLSGLARVAAASQAPLLAAAAAGLLQIDEWRQLASRRDLAMIFAQPEYAAWHRMRASEDSRWVALAMPRFLARRPYGPRDDPVEEFDYAEDLHGEAADRFVWANAAYAMATNIARAFSQYGWCARIRGIESGGAVTGMPGYRFPTDDGGTPVASSTEVVITDRREAELSRAGLMPLLARRGSDEAYFLSAQSLMEVPRYEAGEAGANAALLGRLPFLLAIGRFTHYVKCMARDRIGSFVDAAALQKTLQAWLDGYVDPDPAQSSESVRVRRPLAEAQIAVEEVEDRPGVYRATLFLRPHYQLEGLTTSSRVVTLLLADPLQPQPIASSTPDRVVQNRSADPDEAA